MTESIAYAGEVKLTRCNLISSKGDKGVDLTSLIYQLEIFEDIFASSMSGQLVISETYNLINQLPIIGEEILEIEFSTPTFTEKFTKSFYVYKLTDRIVKGDKKQGYILHFMSFENVNDLTIKISKSFSGNTHDIAQSIFDKHVVQNEVPKKLKLEESSSKIKYVSNYWSPYKNLNYLASKSTDMSSFKASSFLFYESRKNFHFRSLNALLKEQPVFSYVYDKQSRRKKSNVGEGSSVRDVEREYHTAYEMHIDESFDYINRMLNGTFANHIIEHNLLYKNLQHRQYDYWNDFESSNHLGENPVCSEFVEYPEFGSRLETKIIVPETHNKIKDFGAEILSKRIPLLGQTELFKLKLVVPGRTDIEVGQVVEFKMGLYNAIDPHDGKNDSKIDQYWSGRYLITSILHQLNAKDHQMILCLSKDAINSNDGFIFGDVIK